MKVCLAKGESQGESRAGVCPELFSGVQSRNPFPFSVFSVAPASHVDRREDAPARMRAGNVKSLCGTELPALHLRLYYAKHAIRLLLLE